MTENTITAAEVLKSKQNFSSFIELRTQKVIEDLLEGYPNRTIRTIYPQLTPNPEGLVELLKQFESIKKGYLFWFIANEKEDLLKIPRQLNELFAGGSGIFVVKANLNEDKIEFECLLKPELVVKQKRKVNRNTPSKQLQKEYWTTYKPICLHSDYTEMQIKNVLPQHLQGISIGITGVQILQTINTQLLNMDKDRQELYELCEKLGVGITVMKAFGGGDLLNSTYSPAKVSLTPIQCLHYALTRPAVASVMSGARNVKELKESIRYETATDEEKDYASTLSSFPQISWEGHCMYCGHCAPCPKGIDVATVTKFLNLVKAQGEIPETVREHYKILEHKASECIKCGACEKRCPFKVEIRKNMKEAAEVFGE